VFRHAADVTDENYVAWGGLGIAEMRKGKPAEALPFLDKALEVAEPHGAAPGLKYYVGVCYQTLGKAQESLQWLEEAKCMPEQEPDRKYRIGISLQMLGRPAEALSWFQQCSDLPQQAELKYRMGLALLDMNRVAEAEKLLNAAAQAEPTKADFQVGLAALWQKRGNTEEQERCLKAAINVDPNCFAAQRGLAELLFELHQPAEAAKHYAKASQIQAPDVRLLVGFSDALAASGDTTNALVQLNKAAKLAPTNAVVELKSANLYSATGQSERAIAAYRKVLDSDPKNIGALNDSAWILATDPDPRVRDGRDAVRLARRACDESGWKVPVLIGTLAAAYAEAGDFKEAVLKAEKARDLATEQKQEQIAKRNGELLEIYRAGRPYHEH
jgi:tetratricopeptide (TPR) repeat protein